MTFGFCTYQIICYICSMERIKLTKEEKHVLLHVSEYGQKQPRDTSLLVFLHSLSTLQEKQLVVFQANYDEVISASLTVKGAAYLELNPKLKNPIDWKYILLAVLSAITHPLNLLSSIFLRFYLVRF